MLLKTDYKVSREITRRNFFSRSQICMSKLFGNNGMVQEHGLFFVFRLLILPLPLRENNITILLYNNCLTAANNYIHVTWNTE